MTRYHRPLILLILLTAFALRIVGLVGESPPGVAHDEVANWLIDRSILDEGNHAVYFSRAYGHEAGFHYLQAAAIALIGDHLLALRLTAVFGGLLGVAVTFALSKRLFGLRVALLAAGLLAVLFWPVFYSRLGLRAIWLPVPAGLSAVFWWQAWQNDRVARRQGDTVTLAGNITLSPFHRVTLSFMLAGLFAGLSLYTYLAARALPIFYLLFIGYLLLVQRPALKSKWRGVVWFTAVYLITAFPLYYYLQTNPGVEFRVAEVSQPLTDLLAGDVRPVLTNGVKLAGMFGVVGTPLWREGVPGVPVFEPVMALLFYGGVLLSLWRWRDGRYAFILLWLLVGLIPSLVTINAPSHIRTINALVVSTIFPAIFIHNFLKLSTVIPKLSTELGKLTLTLVLFTFFLLYGGRTINLMLNVWPRGGDVPFVWQAAFAEAGRVLDQTGDTAVSLAGWSPETMDSPTMMLLRQNDNLALSHFNPQEGTLIIPESGQIIRPSDLPLDPYWQTWLEDQNATVSEGELITIYSLPGDSAVSSSDESLAQFGETVRFLGYTVDGDSLLTRWQVTAVPRQAHRLFVHFLDENGQQIAETYTFDTVDPQGLWVPHWQQNDLILQRHNLPAAAEQVRLGWFDPYTCEPGPCQNLITEAGDPFLLITLPEK